MDRKITTVPTQIQSTPPVDRDGAMLSTPLNEGSITTAPVNIHREGSSKIKHCIDPSVSDLATLYSQATNTKGLNYPSATRNLGRYQYLEKRYYPPFNSHECPLLDKPTNATTLCPWKKVISEDRFRYPRQIEFAKCLCTHCKGDSRHFCLPIWRKQLVLRTQRRKCVDGQYVYFPRYEVVSVGCACMVGPHQSLIISGEILGVNGVLKDNGVWSLVKNAKERSPLIKISEADFGPIRLESFCETDAMGGLSDDCQSIWGRVLNHSHLMRMLAFLSNLLNLYMITWG